MRRRAQIIAVLIGWSLATGAQWDLVQAFAWGRMFATYVKTAPVMRAVQMTFAPGNMCSVCKAVAHAKQQENNGQVPGGKADVKIVLVYQPDAKVFFLARAGSDWEPRDEVSIDGPAYRPPLPPPRSIV